jgi:hypothetical protein
MWLGFFGYDFGGRQLVRIEVIEEDLYLYYEDLSGSSVCVQWIPINTTPPVQKGVN